MEMKETKLNISGQSISCPAINGERYVAITPVCNLLGIDSRTQKDYIKSHPIFAQGGCRASGVATDEKQREMFSLNLKYFFGWLFGINPNNVKEEKREGIIEFQKVISDTIYEKFVLKPQFEKLKVEAKINKIEQIEVQKKDLKNSKEELADIERFSYEEFKANNNQTKMF